MSYLICLLALCSHMEFTVLNVFQALVGERACYQSVCCYGTQIFYLGTKVMVSRPPSCLHC